MQLVFTGPQREAVALHRILKADGIDAVCMTGTDHPTGAVFIPAEDAETRTAINRAIERMERERDAESHGTANRNTHKRAPNELRWRALALPGPRRLGVRAEDRRCAISDCHISTRSTWLRTYASATR